jgi:hypothetical protein
VTINRLRLRISLRQIAQEAGKLADLLAEHSVDNEDNFEFDSKNPAITLKTLEVLDTYTMVGEVKQTTKRPVAIALPDPRLVRQLIAQRYARGKYFDEDFFCDPAWNMLLDLAAAREEHKRVSVTSLCIASLVPPTTALRYIQVMTQKGLIVRTRDTVDARRSFLTLSDRTADAMARYFNETGILKNMRA